MHSLPEAGVLILIAICLSISNADMEAHTCENGGDCLQYEEEQEMEVSLLQRKQARNDEGQELAKVMNDTLSRDAQVESLNRTEIAATKISSGGVCIGGSMCTSYSDPSSCSNSIFSCTWSSSCAGYCNGGSMCDYTSQAECTNSIFDCRWSCNAPTRRRRRRRWDPPRRRRWNPPSRPSYYTETQIQQDEGNTVGRGSGATSKRTCQSLCDANQACKSFSYTPEWGGQCYLKDKCVHPWDPTTTNGQYKTYYKPCDGDGDQCAGTANCWDDDCANHMFDRRRRDADMASCRRRDGKSSTGRYVCCGNQLRYYT